MRKKFSIKIDLIESKNKVFVYIKKKNGVQVEESEVRKEVGSSAKLGKLTAVNDKFFVFDIVKKIENNKSLRDEAIENFNPEEMEKVDLTLSHAGSDLEPAPEEIVKPKQSTRKTTRKPRTRRKSPTTKKEISE